MRRLLQTIMLLVFTLAVTGCGNDIERAPNSTSTSQCDCEPDCQCKKDPNNPHCQCKGSCPCDKKPSAKAAPKPKYHVVITEHASPIPKPPAVAPVGECKPPEATNVRPSRIVVMLDSSDTCEPSNRMRNETLAAMKNWVDQGYIQVITNEDEVENIPYPTAFPTSFLLLDGKLERMEKGFLTVEEMIEFNGTKKEGAAAPQGYPIRGSWWTHSSSQTIWEHLINTHGYSEEYVRSLSRAEAESLHSDDHDKTVKNGVRSTYGPGARQPALTRRAVRYSAPRAYCPSGNCPWRR